VNADSAPAASDGRLPDEGAMREVACLFCDVHEERLRFRDGDYRVVECERCGHVYVNPRLPSERLHEMYQEEYWNSERAKEFGYQQYLAEAPLYLRTYAMRSEVLQGYRDAPGHVLDVGCAAGFFLKVMADKGWTTTGVEISAPMVDYARDSLGLADMHRGDLLTVDLGEQRFDVISLWDVIEHLERPQDHLTRAHELLTDDGFLVLETQNVGSRFARLMGPKWQHYKHEEHLYHFHPESLGRLLDDVGFEVLENTSKRGGKIVSVDFLVERVGKLHPIFSVLAAPLKLLGDKSLSVNLHDEMVVVARKKR
jgi:2-polyprenyl-3-methyl-5-hydroxy-6-metoxy-1,4-benzoquinol methylase